MWSFPPVCHQSMLSALDISNQQEGMQETIILMSIIDISLLWL